MYTYYNTFEEKESLNGKASALAVFERPLSASKNLSKHWRLNLIIQGDQCQQLVIIPVCTNECNNVDYSRSHPVFESAGFLWQDNYPLSMLP